VTKRNAFALHQKFSIVALWLEYVNQNFRSYVDWPTTSLKADQIYIDYLQRSERENCGLEARSIVFDGLLTKVEIISKGSCRALLTLPEEAIRFDSDEPTAGAAAKYPAPKFKFTQLGNDPVSIKVHMRESDKVLIELDNPIDLNE
jgi:hypothetical protein